MAEYTGSSMVLSWIYSGGTVALNGDYRTASWQPAADMVDTTAGSDANHTFISTLTNASANITLLAQTDGTAIRTALAAGTSGTLIIGPEGTASGKRKITMPAISGGAQYDFTYNDVVTITCSFQCTGAYTDAAY
jgi:hypothetical protein